MLGLEVLYLGSDTWGSLRDFIVAILWGLGLHSGAGVVTTAAVNRTSKLPGAPD
ncbi:MAG: hypothetical protein GY953_42305 [bacterium]|nr:hypothetical protein [bacterium]